MKRYQTTGGTYWWCRRCREKVMARENGSGVCGCARQPHYVDVPYETGVRRELVTASPWVPKRRWWFR